MSFSHQAKQSDWYELLQFVAGTPLPAAAPTAAHAFNKEGKENNIVYFHLFIPCDSVLIL